jgi:high-affinity iron transporter
MLNVFLVVWRESFEAVLVLGILAAALRKQPGSFARARSFLLMGVAGGVVLACLLAGGLLFAQSELQGAMLEWFQTSILFVAATLIVHTCLWMRAHGRNLKRNMERSVSGALDRGSLWPVASLAALAIGREGMETVLFLYGTGLEAMEAGEVSALAVSADGGFAVALGTGWLLSRGLLIVSRAWFFRISTSCLLIIAGGLIVQATGRLVQEGVLPALQPQVWDTSWLLDESTTFGGLVSMFTGYQNAPSLMVVLCYVAFWGCCLGASIWSSRGVGNGPMESFSSPSESSS